jgi:kumamolisin
MAMICCISEMLVRRMRYRAPERPVFPACGMSGRFFEQRLMQSVGVPVPGSHRDEWPGTLYVEPAPSHDVLMSAWLKPAKGCELDRAAAAQLGATPVPKRIYRERGEFERATTFDPGDLETLRSYCAGFGIEVVATHWRSATLHGPVEAFARALGAKVDVRARPDTGARFRHRSGSLHLPPHVSAIVQGVFGLLEWPPSSRLPQRAEKPETALTASAIAARYRFPASDAASQTIAIVQLGGRFKPDDFSACMALQGVSAAAPRIQPVDGATEVRTIETANDVETALDAHIAGALAPGAQVVLYDAPHSERGLIDAVRSALFGSIAKPSVISISYGWPEMLWTPSALDVIDELFVAAALCGVTVICASGDNGDESDWGDGKLHVVAPASSPFALAAGASQIDDGGSEVVWDKRPQATRRTGGGFSSHPPFTRPPWQQGALAGFAGTGRGSPDVAAQTAPGYVAVLDGKPFNASGTSAVAPMWAALVARINAKLGAQAGFFAPLLYARRANGRLFADVTSGNNGAYHAQAGWNPCTGLGTPDGEAILAALARG